MPAPRAADGNDGRAVAKEEYEEEERDAEEERGGYDGARDAEGEGPSRGSGRFAADYVSLGIKEPVYEVGPQQLQPYSLENSSRVSLVSLQPHDPHKHPTKFTTNVARCMICQL
jgi:hypothetical protein